MPRPSMTTLASILVCALLATSVSAQTYTVLHNFTGNQDGATPLAGLTADSAGNLYGTSFAGGAGFGTIFKLAHTTSGWTFTPLYSFAGGMDGAGPYARVNFGPNGALYGTTQGGGGGTGCNTDTYPDLFRGISPNLYQGCGTVFSLQASPRAHPPSAWLETVLYRFTGGSDGGVPAVGDLNFDQRGNIYGSTYEGGLNVNCGVVFELTRSSTSWAEAALYSFSGETDGCSPNAVTFGPSGDLYGTNMSAGAQNSGTVFQLAPAGPPWTAATLYSFPGVNTGEMPLAGVIFDSLGNMYGSNVIQGPGGGGTVFELTASGEIWNLSTLYSFTGSGYGPRATLVMDAAGSLYGTTEQDGLYGYGNVFKLTPAGNGAWTYTSLYDFHGGNDGGYPVSNLVFDASGNLYGTASQGGTGFDCNRGCGVVFKVTP